MWTLLRTRRWQGFTALVVVAVVGFAVLSNWQWERAEEERQALNLLVAETQRPPVPLEQALADPASLTSGADLYRPVDTIGSYVPDTTLLVRQRPLDGRNGFWVVTLFQPDQGPPIWANRGWIMATGASTAIVEPPSLPLGEVSITGRLRPSELQREVVNDLPEGQIRRIDTSALSSQVLAATGNSEVLPVYLEVVLSDVGEPDLLRMPLPEIDETQNVSYAIQWLIFASIALIGWVYFLRREAHDNAQEKQPVS